MQALILAAGMGSRLKKYTEENTKCMLKVCDKTLIERTIEALVDTKKITKLIIVVGYKGENLKKFLLKECKNPKIKEIEIEFIDNPIYDKTNNIYSLSLAKEYLKKDDTILLESDLIYDYSLIKEVVDSTDKNIVTVAKYEQWMDGTVVKVDNDNNVVEFIEKKNFNYNEIDDYYKTVNIYKMSKDFSRKVFVPFLDCYIDSYGKNEYYELVFKIISHLGRSDLKSLDVSSIPWYEIDDAQDLDIAECIFSTGKEKLDRFQNRRGGYWRFSNLLNYCDLSNSYFPPDTMLEKIKYFQNNLLQQSPSNQDIECINASRLFNGVEEDYLCCSNGVLELVRELGMVLSGKICLPNTIPDEYLKCFRNCEIDFFDIKENNFNYEDVYNNAKENNNIFIINPDSLTGSFFTKEEMFNILDEAKKNKDIVIFDESLIDYVDEKNKYTLFDNNILDKYDNLIVIKDIGVSYGIPGVNLGVMATSNVNLNTNVKENISICNINSFAEYFLQIVNLYKNDYINSCSKVVKTRNEFRKQLDEIDNIKVYPSQSNFLLCSLNDYDSTELTIKMLEQGIFIKDLKVSKAFENLDFIRLSVKTDEENKKVVKVLQKIIKNNND